MRLPCAALVVLTALSLATTPLAAETPNTAPVIHSTTWSASRVARVGKASLHVCDLYRITFTVVDAHDAASAPRTVQARWGRR